MHGRCLVVLGVMLALPACGRAAGTGAADVAQVTCERDATQVHTAAVHAQPDGVHVEIDNRAGGQVYVYYRHGDRVRNIQNVAPGTSESVVTEGPGAWELICSSPNRYPSEENPWVALEVSDPDGLWVSDLPDCEHPSGTHPDYREDFEGGTPPGQEGDPIDLAREDIAGAGFDVLPDDLVERAGYPEAQPHQVRLVRGDRVVAVARYQADGEGRWIHRGVDYCEEEEEQGEPEPPG